MKHEKTYGEMGETCKELGRHMVLYAKFILMVVGGECRSVVFILSFHRGSAAGT